MILAASRTSFSDIGKRDKQSRRNGSMREMAARALTSAVAAASMPVSASARAVPRLAVTRLIDAMPYCPKNEVPDMAVIWNASCTTNTPTRPSSTLPASRPRSIPGGLITRYGHLFMRASLTASMVSSREDEERESSTKSSGVGKRDKLIRSAPARETDVIGTLMISTLVACSPAASRASSTIVATDIVTVEFREPPASFWAMLG
jgi:hypothetical protein